MPDPRGPHSVVRTDQVALGIGPAMVVTMTTGEADRIGEVRGRQHAQEQLEGSAGPESAMGEVAMEPSPEREGDEEVPDDERDPVAPGERSPRQGEDRHVEQADAE